MATVAYLTAEIGLRTDLPTYSGGLGVLAGDHVKAAADLGLDLTTVTLLYRNGYARQHITDGIQTETFPAFEPSDVLEDTGLILHDELEGRPLALRLWRYRHVGHGGQHADVIFLDPSVEGNDPKDVALGHRLYGGPYGTRIRQEYILGVCGLKALDLLGIAFTTLHLNEGHCAFAPLELERRGWSRARIASSTLFTTHTPVPAGHDRFTWDEVDAVVGHLMPQDVKDAMGGDMLSMSHLAAHYAGRMNGVSQLNAEVALTMWVDLDDLVSTPVQALQWRFTPDVLQQGLWRVLGLGEAYTKLLRISPMLFPAVDLVGDPALGIEVRYPKPGLEADATTQPNTLPKCLLWGMTLGRVNELLRVLDGAGDAPPRIRLPPQRLGAWQLEETPFASVTANVVWNVAKRLQWGSGAHWSQVMRTHVALMNVLLVGAGCGVGVVGARAWAKL